MFRIGTHLAYVYLIKKKKPFAYYAGMIRESMAQQKHRKKTDQIYSRRLFFTDVNIFRRILTVTVSPTARKLYSNCLSVPFDDGYYADCSLLYAVIILNAVVLVRSSKHSILTYDFDRKF